jgi:hypothetical protein
MGESHQSLPLTLTLSREGRGNVVPLAGSLRLKTIAPDASRPSPLAGEGLG